MRFSHGLLLSFIPFITAIGLAGCQADPMTTTDPLKGYFAIAPQDILIQEETTALSKAYTTPAIGDFNLKITNQENGNAVYEGVVFTEPLLLDIGNYTVQIRYGDASAIQVNAPYYDETTSIHIAAAAMTRIQITATLKNAIIEPEVSQTLADQFSTYQVTVTCNGMSKEVIPGIIRGTPGESLFVPVGSTVSCMLSGINRLGEMVSFPLVEVPNTQVATRYKINCDATLPQFTLPIQPNSEVWSKEIYITEMTAADVTRGNADKILNHIVYEASADGVSWIQAQSSGNRKVISGLTPGTSYTVRSRFMDIPSSNTQTLTTESGTQLPNGDMETSTTSTSMTLYGNRGTMYCYHFGIWGTRNERTTNGAGGVNVTSTNAIQWKYCSGTRPIAEGGSMLAEISTLAFYTKSCGLTIFGTSEKVKSAVQGANNTYAGYLFTGTYDQATDSYKLGVAHDARPKSISFDYAYAPVSGDQCIITAELYDADNQMIAKAEEFHSYEQSSLTQVSLAFNYLDTTDKAASIRVFFQSGTDVDVAKMSVNDGSGASPKSTSRVVGSVLKIDHVTLNY